MYRVIKDLAFPAHSHLFNCSILADVISISSRSNTQVLNALVVDPPPDHTCMADELDDTAEDQRNADYDDAEVVAPYRDSIAKRHRPDQQHSCWFPAELREAVFSLDGARYPATGRHCWKTGESSAKPGLDSERFVDTDDGFSSSEEL